MMFIKIQRKRDGQFVQPDSYTGFSSVGRVWQNWSGLKQHLSHQRKYNINDVKFFICFVHDKVSESYKEYYIDGKHIFEFIREARQMQKLKGKHLKLADQCDAAYKQMLDSLDRMDSLQNV